MSNQTRADKLHERLLEMGAELISGGALIKGIGGGKLDYNRLGEPGESVGFCSAWRMPRGEQVVIIEDSQGVACTAYGDPSSAINLADIYPNHDAELAND